MMFLSRLKHLSILKKKSQIDGSTELNKKKVLGGFKQHFEGDPILIFSPGRINLIGEHTDYNLGFVLPASIDKGIIFALQLNEKGIIRLHSTDMDQTYYEVPVAESYSKTGVEWADYIIGVVDILQKSGYEIGGFDCAFGGNVPIGAGLSSSAALEGGIAYGLSNLHGLGLSRFEMSNISMQAENQFVGVQCGIMDQFASLNGKKGEVIKLDCRSLDYEYYPFKWDDISVLLCDSKVRRTLAGSEYNERRRQCELGVKTIQEKYPEVNSLRDVTFDMLESCKNIMDEIVMKRCMYVLNENRRVLKACEALLSKDLHAFGKLMFESHYGLRDNYEVSCEELDILVEAAEKNPGVLGSRMMGGGFGGCTINLVKENDVENIKAAISSYYKTKVGSLPQFHVVNIGEGTHLMDKVLHDLAE